MMSQKDSLLSPSYRPCRRLTMASDLLSQDCCAWLTVIRTHLKFIYYCSTLATSNFHQLFSNYFHTFLLFYITLNTFIFRTLILRRDLFLTRKLVWVNQNELKMLRFLLPTLQWILTKSKSWKSCACWFYGQGCRDWIGREGQDEGKGG